MTAHRPAKQPPARAPARRHDAHTPTNRWDVILHAIDDWPRTVRLCVIVVVIGAVFAALLTLKYWVLSLPRRGCIWGLECSGIKTGISPCIFKVAELLRMLVTKTNHFG
jgi:hypothetical protein